ncbi:unnamed protein product [Discula destructiva]
MSEDKTSPGRGRYSSAKPALRTYSRHGRAIKRRVSSLHEHLTRWEDVAVGDTGVKANRERLLSPEPSGRRKWSRKSESSLGQRPIDVFWEHLRASAPASTLLAATNSAKAHSPEIGQTDSKIGATAPERKHNAGVYDAVGVNYRRRASKGPHLQRLMTLSEPVAFKNLEQDEHGYEKEGSHDGFLRDALDDTAFTPIEIPTVKRNSLLCLSSSLITNKAKQTRRYQDVDESLCGLESSPAGVRIPAKQMRPQVMTSGVHSHRRLSPVNNSIVQHLVDGFDSPASSWPIPTPTSRRKYANFKEFKKVKAAMDNKSKRSSDGFQRGEAYLGFSGKKRRLDSSDLGIGPLEIAQKGVATEKMAGPTWLRGQKKPRVSTAASLWRRAQHVGTSRCQIEPDKSFEVVDDIQQHTSVERGTRLRSKRRISPILSDEADKSAAIPAHLVPVKTVQNNDSVYDDDEVTWSSHRKHMKSTHFTCDADEPVDLLVFPFDEEGEARSTLPRVNSPKPADKIGQELVAQLPQKIWMLSRLDDNQDALVLRPDSRAWEREVSNVPKISDL